MVIQSTFLQIDSYSSTCTNCGHYTPKIQGWGEGKMHKDCPACGQWCIHTLEPVYYVFKDPSKQR